MGEYPTPPTVADVWVNAVNGRVMIRESVDHPTSGDHLGMILPAVDGDWAWTAADPKDALAVDQWSTADTLQQAAEELLHEHLVNWQDEYDRAVEMEDYNRRTPINPWRVAS